MPDRETTLSDLAGALERRGLLPSARLLLDVVEPVAFLASQVAVFARPFTPRGRWHEYVAALEDEEGWKTLHRIVARHEC